MIIVNRKELDKVIRIFSDDMAIFRNRHKINDGELFLLMEEYIYLLKGICTL